MHFAYRLNDSLSEAKNIDSNIDSTIDMRISIFISLSFRYIPICEGFEIWNPEFMSLNAHDSYTIRVSTYTHQLNKENFKTRLLRSNYPRFSLCICGVTDDKWQLVKLTWNHDTWPTETKTYRKSRISMHYMRLDNIVEMRIPSRLYPCASTHKDLENRLLRCAQTSTFHALHMKHI